jgi:putative addiction module component (TIGR02574 family)
MTPIAKELLDKALALPGSEREALAASLFDSLDRDDDCEHSDSAAIQAEWNDEIGKRIQELNSGQVSTIPWSVARRLIRGEQVDGRSGS